MQSRSPGTGQKQTATSVFKFHQGLFRVSLFTTQSLVQGIIRARSWELEETAEEIQLFLWVFPLGAEVGSRAPHRGTFAARL